MPVPVPYPVTIPVPTSKPLLPGIGYGTEAGVVGAAALEGDTVTVTVTWFVVVTVIGTGQLAPDSIGLPGRPLGLVPGRLKGRAEGEPRPVGRPMPVPAGPAGRVALESGYGAPRVAEAMGRPVPVPVPVCAETEVERARMPASAVKTVNGAIAISMNSVERTIWSWRCKLIGKSGDEVCGIYKEGEISSV